jgi:pilus assembly protein CpaB
MCDVPAMFRRRWPVASKILIGIAVLLGALAFVVVRGYQDRVEATHPAVGPEVTVVIAASDLARGTVLSEAMLKRSSLPQAFVPPGSIRDVASLGGRVLTADIAAGEVITRSRLSEPQVGPIAALVPDGLRAVTIPGEAPQGTIKAGDRIEIYATYGGGQPHTELVASGLEVLRVLTGSTDQGGGIGGTTTSGGAGVTLVLLVDADAASRLAYARSFGQLQVAILGPDVATGSP